MKHSWKTQGHFGWKSMEGVVWCPGGPLAADLQPWVSCRGKIKPICPFYLHPGWGLTAPSPELGCSTPELLRVAACAQTADPRLPGAGKSRLFHPVPGAAIRVTLAALSGCWIWPLQNALLLRQRWERAWLPRTSVLCLCLSNK